MGNNTAWLNIAEIVEKFNQDAGLEMENARNVPSREGENQQKCNLRYLTK